MPIVTPPFLRPGDTIAVVPTARAITVEELQDGIALAEGWGLRVRLGSGVGRKHFQQAGTGAERAADLRSALNDPEVRAIWCARGGYGTIHLMDHLDLSVLRHDPKWIIGFSDVTVLHNALNNLGVASLHAQMPHNIRAKTKECRESLRALLMGGGSLMENGDGVDHLFADDRSPFTRVGHCEGVLVGGNLSLLYALRGTPYDIDPRGKILFIEDLDELLYHFDRMVQNLRSSGWFKDLAGLVVGGMSDMRDKDPADPFGRTAEQIIDDALGDVDYPVCFGFPSGHIADNRALILGRKAKLSVTRSGVKLSFAGLDDDAAGVL
ncbi:MAG: LD-carboxypeptidase [Flavobacteriales bacterium]|jgi:muramoyltetrapeptide carboxypeptidase|nr:LD-carboxypeptidase [Flavobacteriales bacterium]MBK9513782.1 LD-carboxypeptidase [Flavobacteriales bacterium]MBP7449311.1 LD-carboxypeptidase [Flavobacteriales bacterium]HOZ41712.1 LD-carboxypeptidase [Flavobacteriales bacterium]